MKINDVNLNEDRWFGDYGSAVMQNLQNKLAQNGEGHMSTLDRMTKDQYINNFVGLAATNLASAIDSTRVDPNAQSAGVAMNDPSHKVVGGGGAAAGGTTNTPSVTPPAGETPEQKRMRLQKDAQANIDKTAKPVQAKTPTPPVAPTAPATAPRAGEKTRAMIAQKRFNKGTKVAEAYDKLDAIFEGIIMESGMSISDFMQNFVKKQLAGLNLVAAQPKIKELSDKVQATYGKDKGKAAIIQLANLAFTLEHADGSGSEETVDVANKGAAAAASSNPFMQGFDAAQGKQTTEPTATNTAPAQKPAAEVQKEKTVYMQVKGLLDKLDKKGKQRILAALQKQLGQSSPATAQSAPTTPATEPGAQAFNQMKSQLTKPTKAKPVAKAAPEQPAWTGREPITIGKQKIMPNDPKYAEITKRMRKPAVAESKRVIKVWGQK